MAKYFKVFTQIIDAWVELFGNVIIHNNHGMVVFVPIDLMLISQKRSFAKSVSSDFHHVDIRTSLLYTSNSGSALHRLSLS